MVCPLAGFGFASVSRRRFFVRETPLHSGPLRSGEIPPRCFPVSFPRPGLLLPGKPLAKVSERRGERNGFRSFLFGLRRDDALLQGSALVGVEIAHGQYVVQRRDVGVQPHFHVVVGRIVQLETLDRTDRQIGRENEWAVVTIVSPA